jgi:hypothetical protein
MLIAVLASTTTVAILMATAFGLYEEAQLSRAQVEKDRALAFRTARRLCVKPRDR